MKLEDNIKKKLEERRIQPTASAWDRIESKLEAEQGKKKSKVVLWVGIAASFVAGVFLTALLFSGDVSEVENELVQESINQEEVTNDNVSPETLFKESYEETTEIVLEDEQKNENDEAIEEAVEPLLPKRKKKTNTTSLYKPKSTITKGTKTTTAVALGDKTKMLEKEETMKVLTTSESIAVKNEMAIASTTTETSDVTSEEIDALLSNAQESIKRAKHYAPRTNVVDANELLLDVEAEVDPDSFKDKMFRTVRKQFGKAVEAVANKDN